MLNHPKLDPRGGGDKTFGVKLALLGDPDDGSIVRAYAAGWRLPDNWWLIFRSFLVRKRWLINDPTPAGDVWYYSSVNWSFEDVLADTSKKPFPFKVVPVEQV